MDPKRKKLYIIVIVACLILSVGIFVWGQSSTPALPALPSHQVSNPVINHHTAPSRILDTTFPVPPVFPASGSLDTSVLDSTAFKTLHPYDPLKLGTGDLGRDDPFKSY